MRGDRLRELAELLRSADGFVPIAKLVCARSRELFAARRCTICLHAASGRPQIMVDNVGDDVDRLAYLERGWRDDELLRALLQRYALVSNADTLLAPVVEPVGIVASIRCGELETYAQRESDLATVAMLLATRLAELGIVPAPDTADSSLTVRQHEIAELASRGLTTGEIAECLAISPNTVKKLLKQVFERLAINNRVELVHVLRRHRVANSDIPLGITRQGELAIARSA